MKSLLMMVPPYYHGVVACCEITGSLSGTELTWYWLRMRSLSVAEYQHSTINLEKTDSSIKVEEGSEEPKC